MVRQHWLFSNRGMELESYIEREKFRKPGEARALQWGVRESISIYGTEQVDGRDRFGGDLRQVGSKQSLG